MCSSFYNKVLLNLIINNNKLLFSKLLISNSVVESINGRIVWYTHKSYFVTEKFVLYWIQFWFFDNQVAVSPSETMAPMQQNIPQMTNQLAQMQIHSGGGSHYVVPSGYSHQPTNWQISQGHHPQATIHVRNIVLFFLYIDLDSIGWINSRKLCYVFYCLVYLGFSCDYDCYWSRK